MVDVIKSKMLLAKLESLCKQIAQGKYESSDVRELFSITSESKLPKELSLLAEAFGMMMVKVEAREYHLESVISELEETRKRLEIYSLDLERLVSERTEELSLANTELTRLANLDGLTRISNRRLFDRYIENEWRKSKADGTTLTLTMSDVDFFKPFNDHFGHLHGDDCLQTIAETIREVYSQSRHLVARYGGEEFAIVLPDTSIEEALELAETARNAIEGLQIEHPKSNCSCFVTVSSGIAALPSEDASGTKTLISRADRALYFAKGDGRNRTVVFGTESIVPEFKTPGIDSSLTQ
jgi:diguanylate cyclase (GGDEF)-like protein